MTVQNDASATDKWQCLKTQLALLVAAVLFGLCNITWRYGEGNVIVLSFERAAIGTLLLAPFIIRDFRLGILRKLLFNPLGAFSVLMQGIAIVGAAWIFHSLPGPQAALVVAILPAVLIIPSYYLNGRIKRKGLRWVILCAAAATCAVFTGGVGDFSSHSLIIIGTFMFVEMLTILSAEKARQHFHAVTLVSAGMLTGCLMCGLFTLIANPIFSTVGTSGSIAAALVAVFGTAGRLLRNFSLPSHGAAITYSTSQITAITMTTGGIILFGDELTLIAGLLGLIACGSSIAAIHSLNNHDEITP